MGKQDNDCLLVEVPSKRAMPMSSLLSQRDTGFTPIESMRLYLSTCIILACVASISIGQHRFTKCEMHNSGRCAIQWLAILRRSGLVSSAPTTFTTSISSAEESSTHDNRGGMFRNSKRLEEVWFLKHVSYPIAKLGLHLSAERTGNACHQ